MIHIHPKWLFIALPLIITVIIGSIRHFLKVQATIAHLSAPEHRTLMIHHYSVARLMIKMVCSMLAMLLLAFALLRLQYDQQEQQQVGFKRDLMIALDISRSMLAQDAAPTRLAVVKQKIKQLLKQLVCERVGLIIFSGQAIVYCPLTQDFETFNLFLDGVDVESISHGTTHVSAALEAALALWQRSKDHGNPVHSKILILCTDGEDFSPEFATLQQAAKSAQVKLCAWGVGSAQGAPIPVFDDHGTVTGHMKDTQGSVIMSKLNEQMLRGLVEDLGGMYVHLDGSNHADIDRSYDWITQFEREEVTTETTQARGETFMIATGLALIALIIGWIL